MQIAAAGGQPSLLTLTIQQIGLPPWTFAADRDRPSSHSSPGYYSKASRAARKERREKALAKFREHGPMDAAGLAEKLGIDHKEAGFIISGLVAVKAVYRLEDGRYQPTESA